MENDLKEAKKYIESQGYGSGTNYTTNLVAVLLANYQKENKDKILIDLDTEFEEYAIFCIECFKKGMNPIIHKDYIKIRESVSKK